MLHKNIRSFLSNIGKKGGKARWEGLTPEERREITRKGGLKKAENRLKREGLTGGKSVV